MNEIRIFVEKIKQHGDKLHATFGPELANEVARFGLGMFHFKILTALVRKHDSPIITSLARELKITYPTMTYLVDLLEKKRLVMRKRVPEDRRAVRICLTSVGKKIMHKIIDSWGTRLESYVTGMEKSDRDNFINSVENLLGIIIKYHAGLKTSD